MIPEHQVLNCSKLAGLADAYKYELSAETESIYKLKSELTTRIEITSANVFKTEKIKKTYMIHICDCSKSTKVLFANPPHNCKLSLLSQTEDIGKTQGFFFHNCRQMVQASCRFLTLAKKLRTRFCAYFNSLCLNF